MNSDVFKSEEDGYWYYRDDEYMVHGPFEDEDTAHGCMVSRIPGMLMESLGRDE